MPESLAEAISAMSLDHRTNAAHLLVGWVDSGREPQCAPDPAYPAGVDIDTSNGAARTCHRALPYPAKRCGYFLVQCMECELSCVITTAGRVDDPRSVTLRCKERMATTND
jgi:hypothetical protein